MRAVKGKGQNETLAATAPFKLSKTKRSTWRWAAVLPAIGTASALSLLIRLLINFVHISIWLLTVIILFFVKPGFHR